MFSVSRVKYGPILRGKLGELLALSRLFDPHKEFIAPTVIVPSITAKDLQKKRPLTPKEATRIHIGRISESWKGIFFLECRFIKFDADEIADARLLREMLDNAKRMRCLAIPVVDLRTNSHRIEAIRDYVQTTSSGVAIRISIADVDKRELESRVTNLLEKIGVSFNEAILQLDFGEATILDTNNFADLIVNSFTRLMDIGPWERTIIAASNYPDQNPASPNNSVTVARREWDAWKRAASLDARIKDSIFGDFGADHGKVAFFDSNAPAVTHLRYAVADSWLISRGGPCSDVVDGSIRGAALVISSSKFFAGETFSWGDQFISDCANNLGTAGYPTIWRAANMNHHMTRALVDLGDFLGDQVRKPERRYSPLQQALPL